MNLLDLFRSNPRTVMLAAASAILASREAFADDKSIGTLVEPDLKQPDKDDRDEKFDENWEAGEDKRNADLAAMNRKPEQVGYVDSAAFQGDARLELASDIVKDGLEKPKVRLIPELVLGPFEAEGPVVFRESSSGLQYVDVRLTAIGRDGSLWELLVPESLEPPRNAFRISADGRVMLEQTPEPDDGNAKHFLLFPGASAEIQLGVFTLSPGSHIAAGTEGHVHLDTRNDRIGVHDAGANLGVKWIFGNLPDGMKLELGPELRLEAGFTDAVTGAHISVPKVDGQVGVGIEIGGRSSGPGGYDLSKPGHRDGGYRRW